MKVKRDYPSWVHIETTDLCNQNPPCVMCNRVSCAGIRYDGSNRGDISEEIVEKLVPFIQRADRLVLHGQGEPLLYKGLFKLIGMAKKEALVEFTSNGQLLSPEMRKKILDCEKIDNIDFSLDAATEGTYRKIRHKNFSTVVKNIANLVKERDKRNFIQPKIFINMVLMLENMSEAGDFVRLGNELGAAQVHLYHMNVPGYQLIRDWFVYQKQHCSLQPELHDKYIEEAFRIADELGVNLRFSGQLFTKKQEKLRTDLYSTASEFYCDIPFKEMGVCPNGDVINCCYQEGRIGDLKNQSPEEIWFGNPLEEIRTSTEKHIPHRICCSKENRCWKLGKV